MDKEFIITTSSKIKRMDYSLRIVTSGIKLDRMLKNPIMLFNHNMDTVIGKWDNLRLNGDTLIAKPIFSQDEFSQKIAKDVEQDIIRGASISIDPINIIRGETEDEYIITECEMIEASIVSVPANADTLSINSTNRISFSKKSENKLNKLIKLAMEQDEKDMLVALEDVTPINEVEETDAPEDELTVVSTKLMLAENTINIQNAELQAKTEAIDALTAKLLEYTATIATLTADLERFKAEKMDTLVNAAITEGRISPANREQFLKLPFDSVKAIIDNLPKVKASLSNDLANLQTTGANYNKTYDWYLKNDKDGLRKLSRENPSLYKALENEYSNKIKN